MVVHRDLDGWEYYDKSLPLPKWTDDGTLSVWLLAHDLGGMAVSAKKPSLVIDGDKLIFCFVPENLNTEEPYLSGAFPVVVEFRALGIKKGEFTIAEVSWCE